MRVMQFKREKSHDVLPDVRPDKLVEPDLEVQSGTALSNAQLAQYGLAGHAERAFGSDLADVRIHHDGAADAVGAQAFARGNDVHLGRDADLSSRQGQELLGHELAHVVQQRQGRVAEGPQHKGGANQDAALEAEADAAGVAFADGRATGLTAGGGAGAGVMQMKPKPKDELLFIGMSDGSHDEIRELRKVTAVAGVTDAAKDDTIKHGAKTFDLTGEQGIRDYLAALGVPAAKIEPTVEILMRCGGDARDEVAQIVRIYHQAEIGYRVLDRVVLSGHSSGTVAWGDSNGVLEYERLAELAKVFTGAVAQVRDLMLSACFTGEEGTMEQYHRMYPNLDSIWAYSGSSPGTHSGAKGHMRVWEKATRGKQVPDMDAAHKEVSRHRKGDQVATWTKDDGYHGKAPMTYADALAAVQADEATFQSFYRGDEEVADAGSGPMFEYYQKLHRLVGHPDIPDGDRAHWEERKEQVLRLRYWAKVRQKFGAGYRAQLDAGFKEAGVDQPSWGALTRAAAIALDASLAARAGAGSAAAEAARLVAGLAALDKDVIPPQWV